MQGESTLNRPIKQTYLHVYVPSKEANVERFHLAPLLGRKHKLDPETGPTPSEERWECRRRASQVFP